MNPWKHWGISKLSIYTGMNKMYPIFFKKCLTLEYFKAGWGISSFSKGVFFLGTFEDSYPVMLEDSVAPNGDFRKLWYPKMDGENHGKAY